MTVTAGATVVQTAANGSYSLPSLAATNGTLVSYSKEGYLPTAASVAVVTRATPTHNLVMAAMAPPLSLDATAGGTVMGLRGATLTAEANAFVDVAGNAVQGMVSVFLRPLDPAVGRSSRPIQELSSASMTAASATSLSTYGQYYRGVTVQQGGQSLQVASGKALTITIPATVVGTSAAQSDLWSFDTATGIWDHEGTAALSAGLYTATLHHLCWHTVADGSIEAACFTGSVSAADGTPIPNATNVISSATETDRQHEGTYMAYPLGSGSRYCVWGEPGPTTTITATALQPNGHIASGSIVVNNVLEGFPDPSGQIYVGSCVQSYSTGVGVPFSGCQMVPNIVLGQSTVVDAGAPTCAAAVAMDAGVEADGGISDPFGGTCAAEPLTTFLSCFNASGGCFTTAPASGGTGDVTTTFGDGASVQFTQTGNGSGALHFFGPDQQLCGTGTTNASSPDLVLTLGSSVFILSQSSIVCPSGDVIPLTDTQRKIVNGCQGTGGGCGGNDAGVEGSGGTSCTYSTNGAPAECTFYSDLSSTDAMQMQTNCVAEMEVRSAALAPTANRKAAAAMKVRCRTA